MNTQGRGSNRISGRTNTGAQRINREDYIQGNTVRKLKEMPGIEKRPVKKVSVSTRRNRDRAFYMSFSYVAFLATALVAIGFILVSYIALQSDITNSVAHISRLESELNDLKLANDEEYSRITSSVNLDEVKRIAIQELGMKYAQEGQIVYFEGEGSDYVRQLADIPE